MLRRSHRAAQLRAVWYRTFATQTSAIPPAYQEYKNMMADMKKKYPGLYPTEKEDVKIQQQLLDNQWDAKNLEASCNEYNNAYQNLWDNWSFDKMGGEGRYERAPRFVKEYLKTLDYDYLLENKPSPVAMKTEDWSHMDRKMAMGARMVAELEERMADKPKDTAGQSLKEYQCDQIKKRLKDWVARIQFEDDEDKTWTGLPFDSEMMNQVLMDIKTARTKDWLSLSAQEKKDRTQSIIDETWASMYDKVIKFTQPDRTKAEFDALQKVYFETLDPTDIGLGRLKDLSKLLFLQAYWNGGEKLVFEIDEQCKKLREVYETMPADYVELWKEALKMNPDLKMSGEIGLFIKALEVAFVPKLLNQLRTEHAGAHFVRSGHQVMLKCHEDDFQRRSAFYNKAIEGCGDLEEEKKKLREEMFEYADLVDQMCFKQNYLKKELEMTKTVHEARKDMPLPTLEEMLSELVDEALWVQENDSRKEGIEKFKKNLMAYMKSGKGDMLALEKEAKGLFPSNMISEKNPIDDREYMRTFVTFVRGERKRMDAWSFKDAFWARTGQSKDKIDHKRQILMNHMKGNFHDVLCRTVKHLTEENKMADFEVVLDHYGQIVKKHKGEVYGSLVSAADLTDKQFQEIVDVLQKQNPGKKYFLKREVDPTLLAGFMINCGAHKIDYSLSSEQTTLKKKLGM